MLRKIIIPKEERCTIKVPKEYLNRKIEILIFPFDVEYESEEQTTERDEDTRLFWASFGGWQDDRTPEEIIEDIYSSRTATEREVQL